MLKHMRKHAKYFYALFVIVILSFIFWGTGKVGKDSENLPLAQIGDETITVQEYWRTNEEIASLYRDVYGSEFDAEAMDLKDQVLKTMIQERLLLIAAREAGMTVSDKELEEAIVNDPAFTRDGAFNKDVYRNSLNIYRMSASQYETLKRRDLLLQKMRRLVVVISRDPRGRCSQRFHGQRPAQGSGFVPICQQAEIFGYSQFELHPQCLRELGLDD
ncbi:MAG: SurA N-terminal domain-containing protein, partial [Nitrospirota bacterium]